MKIALVHDYLREYGGAERVVEALHDIWPGAPLYTSFVDWEALGDHAARFKNWDIRTVETAIPGLLKVPGMWMLKKFHSPLRFLAPKIWDSFDLSAYDVVLSSSGWFMCRGVRAGRRASGLGPGNADSRFSRLDTRYPLHICYIHHPPRNLYGYPTGSTIQKYAIVRAYAQLVNFFLRHYDYETAQKVDYFIANSHETQRRVEKFYRRDSAVIYPPVETNRIKNIESRMKNTSSNRDYFLSVGRLSWAKRIDLAIQASNELKLPLKVVGAGKEDAELQAMAGPTIEFVGAVSDEELADLYRGAKALIFTALEEDFGIVPVEAMAAGTPVIALAQGGVRETVIDGKTGIWFHEPTVESLVAALKKFTTASKRTSWESSCRTQAARFSKTRFVAEIKEFVDNHYSRNK